MAKKLGKKARKFAKKNLQSVLRQRRKNNAKFKKKKSSKRDEHDATEYQEEDMAELSSRRNQDIVDSQEKPLDSMFSEDDSDVDGDDSDSDGYLLEDSSCTPLTDTDCYLDEKSAGGELSVQNQEILVELENAAKRLERLRAKDPEFSRFLESRDVSLKSSKNEDAYSDDDEETSNDGTQSVDEDGSDLHKNKLLTCSAVNSWCQLIKEQHSVPVLIRLLNAYRAACHYGTERTAELYYRIQDSETFCKILMFMLREADNVLRGMLDISSANCKRATISELKNTSKWKTLRPLIKSYLKSTLFILNHATDSEILVSALTGLRASIVFFANFPALLHRLVKIAVHLWATGEGALSLNSFLILQAVASNFSSDCFDTCFIKMYKAFIGSCKFLEPALFKHIQFLRNSFVELCSQDVQKSSSKAMISIETLSRVVQTGLRIKKKEAVKKTCSWQYANCLDLWVEFVSLNIRDYELQPLLYNIIQIINGVAVLFPGARYLPLRRKCVEWLNRLSASSGIFIPVTSLVLDILEYKVGKEGINPGKDFKYSSAVKLPKHWLKSRNFQEECTFSVIELLAEHFANWSYHISFPELATIPLIRLRRFQERTTTESFRRAVKRFIEMVEKNIEFVQKKRDDVAFSPKDSESAEAFLQLEKASSNAPFTQYYKSIIEKAASRNFILDNTSVLDQKKMRRKRGKTPLNKEIGSINGGKVSVKKKFVQSVDDGRIDRNGVHCVETLEE